MAQGLRKVLNDYTGFSPRFEVIRRDHRKHEDINRALAEGFPVIALVNNLGHWVVISGYDGTSGQYMVHDDWDYEPWTRNDVDLYGHGVNKAWAWIAGKGYEEGTIITFGFAQKPQQLTDAAVLITVLNLLM